MQLYQWMCLLGIPGMIASFLAVVLNLFKQMNAVKKGMQAVLRNNLLSEYRRLDAKGYSNYDERANWLNMYEQYHMLGANGVMDDIRTRFLALPTKKDDQ